MVKKDAKNKKVSFGGNRCAHDGQFADIQKEQKTNTAKALDALVSIKLSRQERDNMLNAIDS